MQFESGHLYHIYNQGNNRQKIFFSRNNYLFFLNKIREHILPHADVLAWCLMPNHFHLMIYVHSLEAVEDTTLNAVGTIAIDTMTQSHRINGNKIRTLQDSIAIMLRSYTRAINKQENRTGSLFRPHSKAECLTKLNGITPVFFSTAFGAQINVRIPEKEYPQACFNYIHQNPVSAKLVKEPKDWEFSSYADYLGVRKGKLVNKERAHEFVEFQKFAE